MLDSTLGNRLEFWGFENSVMVFRDFSLGTCLRLTGLDISCASNETVNSVQANLRGLLNGCPAGLALQFVQKVTKTDASLISFHGHGINQEAASLISELSETRVSKYENLNEHGELPRHHLYLFIRKPFDRPPETKFLKFKRSAQKLTDQDLQREINSFLNVVEGVQSSLDSIGMKPAVLNEKEALSLIFDEWNPEWGPGPGLATSDDVRDQIALTDAVIGPDHFMLGAVHHKVISLKNLPEQTYAGLSEVLRGLPFDSTLKLPLKS